MDLLATAASRAEVEGCGIREAFALEVLDRLADAGETPDAEICAEILNGHRGRKLEIDAWALDDADGSLHLFIVLLDGRPPYPSSLNLTEAREHGFNRIHGVFEQARDAWLTTNIEESRPLWALARRILGAARPTALRLHVLTDRPISERLREIPGDHTREQIPITFQIWDVTRLKRIHEAHSVRDDLIVDFSQMPGGGLPILPASVGAGDYTGFLSVVPGEVLAEIYARHGSRLLEGNVRTFLGRSGRVNKGIGSTIADEPSKFFAYNNGIATTASDVTTKLREDGTLVLVAATDLQIVNGAQTTASLAVALKDKKLAPSAVFVPMKLSVVSPTAAADLIPRISRFANSQNSVRASDFFANHEFHRKTEEMSRRILAPSSAGSQIQTHWYYERARGQHLNDQSGMTGAQRNQFLLLNPRKQVIKKTDFAKIECCFNLEPDIACKGAEKAFTAFADFITNEWADEWKRSAYGDDWFKAAVARVILFRSAEACISKETWYEGGYRAQIVAYTCARLAKLASEQPSSGGLDYLKIWTHQTTDEVLLRQIGVVGQAMANVLLSPPVAGRNISEWAKQQGCRRSALSTDVPLVGGFESWLISKEDQTSARRNQIRTTLTDNSLDKQLRVLSRDAAYWTSLRQFCIAKRLLSPFDERALVPACQIPHMAPTESQAGRLLDLVDRATKAGWSAP
ncbi:AIPR family protein [Rhodoplanes sp. Z2-YC6860]|uniref:AIPR family protein n=1 Tax=Rhodoplanes sp. Z2-YC6860 TaxID=674703 RepID=UPI0018DCD362|nr:AIPR family protein [Rhodoplanes sp. Z2-YC6860]